MVLQLGFQGYNKPGCSLVHRRLAQHSAWMAWSSHRRLTSTLITCQQLTLRRLRRDYQGLMTIQSQAWLTYRSSSSQGSERSEGSVTAKTSWRLTPMRNARDQLSSPLLPLTSELPSALSCRDPRVTTLAVDITSAEKLLAKVGISDEPRPRLCCH